MQYSPKLKKAMEEIKAVLDKHDIAGSIVLHTPGHGEFLMKINPSYSCAFIDHLPGGQQGIRFRSRLQEDHQGDAAKRHKAQEDTANMFDIMSSAVGQEALKYMDAMDLLKEHLDITSTDGGSSSHNTQNN